MSEIENLIKMKNAGAFENYIEYIQFPRYKNLKDGTRINFKFPITVLVGKNGAGKSSTLHALYGSIKGKTCSDFWFSTEVDPINEEGGRPRYFYGYRENKFSNLKEVRMSRIKRTDTETDEINPDYWETTRPSHRDGMQNKNRENPVEKDVIYLDFRAEVSAFDKKLYFSIGSKKEKKDYLRKQSIYLSRAFAQKPIKKGGNRNYQIVTDLDILSSDTVEKISDILGKKYVEIRVLDHRIYRNIEGTSVYLKTRTIDGYSEANAGSGEIAVVQMVRKIEKSKDNTLVLLDEPEVSLHPSAQRRLRNYLLDACKRKRLQIVISTHSPSLIEGLPPVAIKLFKTENDTGKFYVKEDVYYDEAFLDIEEKIVNKRYIYCEDFAAQQLLISILKKIELEAFFEVMFFPGGEGFLLKYFPAPIVNNDELKKNIYFIIDGDKDTNYRFNRETITAVNSNSLDYLKNEIKKTYGIELNLPKDGGRGGKRDDQEIEQCKKYLDFHTSNIFYLPNKKIPEAIMLNCGYVKKQYKEIINGNNISNENAKDILLKICEKEYGGDTSNYNSNIIRICNKWIQENTTEMQEIAEVIQRIYCR